MYYRRFLRMFLEGRHRLFMYYRLPLLLCILIILLAACGGVPATSAPTITPPAASPPAAAVASVTPGSAPSPSVSATGAAGTPLSATPTPTEFRIDVGGYELAMTCAGEGSPTVILDAGGRDSAGVWWFVQPKVATFTRVCSYDRAGVGFSDPAPIPRTSKDMVEDLHILLTKANISRPYVLVGHSLAGFNLRLYASQHPQEVTGMVLVDSVHPDQWSRQLAVLPSESPNQSVQDWRSFVMSAEDRAPEGLDWDASVAQVRAASALDAIPLIVLTAGQPSPWSEDPGIPSDVKTKLDQEWWEMQKELADLSTNSQHIIVENSGHRIHEDQPEVVIDAIRKVVEAARKGTRVDMPE